MTSVKQSTQFTCGLACIESLAKDKGIAIDQAGMFARFPALLHRADGMCGITTPYIFISILTDLKLGSAYALGIGRAFVEAKKDRIGHGIFLFTERDDAGTGELAHVWRLENILADSFVVVEPTPGVDPFMKHDWRVLDARRCTVLVVEQ